MNQSARLAVKPLIANLSTRVLMVGLMVLWLIVWQAGRLVEYTQHTSLWFPPAGLTFAALLLFKHRAVLPILLAAAVATFWTNSLYDLAMSPGDLLLAGTLFGAAHLSSYILGAGLVGYWFNKTGYRLATVIVASLVVVALSSLLATWLELKVLIASGMMLASQFSHAWLPYWVGDMAGVLAMCPLFIGLLMVLGGKSPGWLFNALAKPWPVKLPTVTIKIAINLLLILVVMVLAIYTSRIQASYAMFFLVLPHMWLACTESPMVNAIALAISSTFIVFMVHMLGLLDYALIYQFAICVIAANGLFGMTIVSLAADNQLLHHMVSTDSLTQAASRERLIEHASLTIQHCQRRQQPLSLIVFDIDYFKQINDQYGHHVGDATLQIASEICQSCLRPADLLGRFGGDEFVVVLPDTPQQQAEEICQRILRRLNNHHIQDNHPLQASFGIAQSEPKDDFQCLFQRADRALYQAKQQGRNGIMADVA